jgi:hydrogenase nickel incorporation protein HypA/HybF
MHELSLVQDLLALTEAAAQRDGATRIETIGLRVGALSGAVPEMLESAFSIARCGTMAERARLEITFIPLVAFCKTCQREFEVTDVYSIARCPTCYTISSELRQGQELDISYLEVS